MDGIMLGAMATCHWLTMQCRLLLTFPLDLGKQFDHWSGCFPTKSMNQCQMVIQMMSSIHHAQSPAKFLSIKTPVLWVAW